MKARIPIDYLPPKSPLHSTITTILAAEVWSFPEWACALLFVFMVFIWVGWIYWCWAGEEIKAPPFDK